MKVKVDTLKYVKLLTNCGVNLELAEPLVTAFADTEIWNLYSKEEVNTMLPEAVQEVFRKHQEELDRRLAEQRREFDKRFEMDERRFEADERRFEAEAKTNRRWMIGTVITVGVALAGYLSALIHFTH